MTRPSTLTTLALLLLLTFLTLQVRATELWLRVGEMKSLRAERSANIRIGARGVVRVVDSPKAIQIIGLKPGTTTITVGKQTHTIHVNWRSQRDFAFRLKALMHNMMGLHLETETHTLTITGTLLKFSDWLKIAELAKQTQGEYRFAAHALPDVAEAALAHLNEKAKKQGFPVVRFRADPIFTAQLPRAAASLREGATTLFAPYGIAIESRGTGLALQPLVRTKVILAEVSRDQSGAFGVEWPSGYQAQVLPRALFGEEGLMATLRALESRGLAQILASPNLLCRSGAEARFHAGGEFPIRVYTRTNHDVIWKQHGVLLRVKPQADFEGAMSLEVETEVSLLDMANSVEGIPALKSNMVKSHFDLPGRRTIALSGLLRQETGDSTEGLPYLSRLPLLGSLFSSTKYLRHQSELVVFVTPEIYVPEHDEKIEMPAGWVSDAI